MKKRNEAVWDVVIVGAGASGMMAAITAARRGRHVLLLEHMDKPGKKLLATGNGRCNFTNAVVTPDCYYGDRTLFAAVYDKFQREDTLAFFREIGVFPKEKNGYYYPNSMQAASVADALVAELRRSKVSLMTGVAVEAVDTRKNGFVLRTSVGALLGKSVILATGLRAAPKLGSDGSVFSVIENFGHHFTPVLPALCGFSAKGMDFKKVSGVRCDANLTLVLDGEESASERGELQLADYGVSGIPVFQLSSPAVRALHEKQNVEMKIDFLPDFSAEEVERELRRRFSRDGMERSVCDSLCGLLHGKLIPVLLQRAGINVHQKSGEVDNAALRRLSGEICACSVTLTEVRDFSYAQVCCGGIQSNEIDFDTLSSKLVPRLYFAGELLDVDGICGGYNLQWAWSSGYVAGSQV